MAFFRHYRCPDCNGTFKWLHHPSDSPPPDRCQLCNAWMLEDPEPVFVAQAPSIGTSQGKSPDQVYRQMETASEVRAELMAEAGGGTAADYAHTKITDMHDNPREGDVAAKLTPPPNYVQEFMKLNPAPGQATLGGYAPIVAGATPIEYAAATRSGPFPYAGAQTADRIRAGHAQMARMVQRAGQENK